MANQIQEVILIDRLQDPTQAEVWISIIPESLAPSTEVRGRFVGPHCAYSTTVEVAYPLRCSPRALPGVPDVMRQVIIPEPTLWDPQSPFLYRSVIELWEEGQRSDQLEINHGLRALYLTPRGLRLNGQPFTIHGIERSHLSEDDASRLRQASYNTMLTPVSNDTTELWDHADRLGFFVLGRLDNRDDSLRQARNLAEHTCCLGWVLINEPSSSGWLQAARSLIQDRPGRVIGVELHGPPVRQLPEEISFVLCSGGVLPLLEGLKVPRLIRLETPAPAQGNEAALSSTGILGWIGSDEKTA